MSLWCNCNVILYCRFYVTQKKHGYLTRKKLHDPQGKRWVFFSSRLMTLGCFVFTFTNCLSLSLFTPFLLSPSPPPQSTPRTCRVKGSWQKLYVILQESQLFFYTDHKAAKEQPGAKPLSVFPLLQAVVSPYNKEKKKFVFQVWTSAPHSYYHLDVRPWMFFSPNTDRPSLLLFCTIHSLLPPPLSPPFSVVSCIFSSSSPFSFLYISSSFLLFPPPSLGVFYIWRTVSPSSWDLTAHEWLVLHHPDCHQQCCELNLLYSC